MKISLILASLLLLCRFAVGEAVVVTLEGVGDRVRAQNPDLQAARLLIQEAVGRARDAGRLANPSVESEFEAGPGMAERTLDIGVSQAFPLTNRLRLEKTISALAIREADAEVEHQARQLVAVARELAVDVMALRGRRELLQQQATLNQSFVEALRASVEKGEGSPLDLGQAQLEANKLALELTRMAVDQTTVVGQLKRLLGMTPEQDLLVTGNLPEPVATRPDLAIADRPDRQVAKLRLETAQREVELERARRMDDVELGLFASMMRRDDEPEGLESDRMLGFQLSIPLPLWNRNQGAIDEATARKQRRQLEAAAIDRSLQLQGQTAAAEMRQWQQLITEINDKLLPLAEQQQALADQAYRNGQTEIQTLLSARQQVLELLDVRLDALRRYHLARVRYPLADSSNPTSSDDEN